MTTTPGKDELAAEFGRLAGVSSVITAVARCVNDLVQLAPEKLPSWLTGLGVPPGWRIARVAGAGTGPARIALCGQHPDGRWDGCETVSVFGFTGAPPQEVVRANADRALRDLGADDITISMPAASLMPGVRAVRSNGYLTAAGQRVWAQYSTYVAGSTVPGEGRLIQQSILTNAHCRERLAEDIARLSNDLQLAFLTDIDERPNGY